MAGCVTSSALAADCHKVCVWDVTRPKECAQPVAMTMGLGNNPSWSSHPLRSHACCFFSLWEIAYLCLLAIQKTWWIDVHFLIHSLVKLSGMQSRGWSGEWDERKDWMECSKDFIFFRQSVNRVHMIWQLFVPSCQIKCQSGPGCGRVTQSLRFFWLRKLSSAGDCFGGLTWLKVVLQMAGLGKKICCT